MFHILIKCYILKYSAILKNKLLKSPGESNHESLVSAKKDFVTAFFFILLTIELEKLLINQIKSQLLVGQKCLLSIISNVTNNKINFKTTVSIRFDLLQVCRLLLYLLFYLYFLLIFWAVTRYMFNSICWRSQLSAFWYILWHSSFNTRGC